MMLLSAIYHTSVALPTLNTHTHLRALRFLNLKKSPRAPIVLVLLSQDSMRSGKLRSRAKLYCRLISDSILRLFYFTPRCLVDVTL